MYKKNPSLEIINEQSREDGCLLTVIYKNGRSTFRVNAMMADVLTSLPSSFDLSELKNVIQQHSRISDDAMEAIINDFLLSKKIIIHFQESSTCNEIKTDSALSLRKTLATPNFINPLARTLKFLFNRYVLLILGCFLLCVNAALLYGFANISRADAFNELSAADSLLVFALIGIGLFFHEIGHATAAYRYGSRNVNIGVGWYIYFIVFFADLSESWAVSKRRKLVIDLAGSYFQSIFIAALWAAYALTGIEYLYISGLLLAFYNILNLNPFFRLDGYWIVSDMLGRDNLREAASTVQRSFFTNPVSFVRRYPEFKRTAEVNDAVVIYALCSAVFYAVFFVLIYAYFFPITVTSLFTLFSSYSFDSAIAVQSHSLLLIMMKLLFSYFVVKKSVNIISQGTQLLSRTMNKALAG